MADGTDAGIETFSWQCGRSTVQLAWLDGAWTVLLIAPCRLSGPPQVLYQASHANPLHAAWDLQVRVGHASRDEDEAVRAGCSAARWLRERAYPAPPGAARQALNHFHNHHAR